MSASPFGPARLDYVRRPASSNKTPDKAKKSVKKVTLTYAQEMRALGRKVAAGKVKGNVVLPVQGQSLLGKRWAGRLKNREKARIMGYPDALSRLG